MPLKDDYRSGQPLAAIRAAWLNAVAKALNTLTIAYTDDTLPSLEKPPHPSTRSPWRILIPKAIAGDHPDRWGRVALRPFGTGDEPQEGVAVGDPCLWQYRETWDAETKAYKEAETPIFVGKLPSGAGLPDGLIIPGHVMLKTNTNLLQQGYLRWDAAKGAFVDQVDDTGAYVLDDIARLNVTFGPLEWEQQSGGAYSLVQRMGYISPAPLATPGAASWTRGPYTAQSDLPAVSYAATHVPEIL